jgi:hypothetical protein
VPETQEYCKIPCQNELFFSRELKHCPFPAFLDDPKAFFHVALPFVVGCELVHNLGPKMQAVWSIPEPATR